MKLLKFPSKGVTNLRERELKNNQNSAQNVHVSFPMSGLEFFNVIG